MSILKDILTKGNTIEQTLDSKEKITLQSGVTFLDANKSKIVVSVVDNNLVITKVIRNLESYSTEDIVLKKEFIPVLGEMFLEFYNKGNLNKIQSKLVLDESMEDEQ